MTEQPRKDTDTQDPLYTYFKNILLTTQPYHKIWLYYVNLLRPDFLKNIKIAEQKKHTFKSLNKNVISQLVAMPKLYPIRNLKLSFFLLFFSMLHYLNFEHFFSFSLLKQ